MKNGKNKIIAIMLTLALALTGIFPGTAVKAAEASGAKGGVEPGTALLESEEKAGPAVSEGEEYAGYLFAYFTGASRAIHFAVSADGYHYTALNGNKAVITQTVGRKSARDPYIIKGQNGDYYMMATDLYGGNQQEELDKNGNYVWGANTGIVTWHSTDLVNWDNETLITIRGEYGSTSADNQRMVWAPEAIWDKDKGEYMIYWSMEGGEQHGDKLMIWYSYTKDFKSLTQEPKVLYNPGPSGLNLAPVQGSSDTNCLDADIVEHDGKFYMYYKWSGGSNAGTQLAVSDKLTEGYLPIGYDVSAGTANPQSPGELCGPKYVEGGDVYKLNGQEKWILIADYNWEKYYGMAQSDDLVHWDVVAEPDCTINFSEGDGNPKHGAVIPITAAQYEALWEKWGKTSADGTGSSSTTIPHTVSSAYPDSPYAGDSTITPNDGNPIAAYDFEAVEGNVIKDTSGRGNDAVMVGTKGSGSDQWSINNGVLKLNNSATVRVDSGNGSYLKLPDIFDSGMDTMTISFDVNTGASQHKNYFTWVLGDESITCGSATGKYFYGRVLKGSIMGHITKSGYASEIKADSTVPMENVGTTVNIMYVIKPDRISVFRDGVLVGEAATAVKISDLGASLKSYFGKSFYGDNGLFNGSFDNIEIYNRALTDAEILEKYPQTGSNSVLQKVSIQGGKVIREVVDEADHTVTQYVSVNNSTVKNLKSAAVDFTVLSGYTISGLKGTYNLLDGAKVTVTSKTEAADRAEWTIKAVPCNNPALGGLYADPDIDVFDGKYYIYPTTDGYTGWNTQKFHVFSSEDMVEWKDEGVILDLSKGDVAWADTKNCYAWAPAIERKNGKYYFYFCGRDKSTNQQAIGVAVADSPTGPFVAKEEPLMTKAACEGAGGKLSQAIDPAIYTDEETGDSYMLFGNGGNGYNIVKLNEDMVSWDADTMYHYPDGVFPNFRESIHVFKKDGKYHFTWSCNDTGEDTYSISYAVADSLYPQKNADNSWGNFTAEHRGTILYKVPEEDILGTGHHCFVKLPGTEEYYIAYARFDTPLSDYVGDKNVKGCHREVCLEKVSFDADGYIQKIIPTHQGIQQAVTANVQVVYKAEAGGKVKAGNGAAQAEVTAYIPYQGTGTTVTAVPEQGKVFDRWSDGVKTAARTDIGEKDTTVTAYFKNNTHVHAYTKSVQPATTKKDGKIVMKCACGDVKSTSVIPRIKSVKLSAETFTYNNKAKMPKVTVYDKNSHKVSNVYYSVTEPSGRKKIGTYKVTVKFKGNYSGTVTKKFKIVPEGAKLTKVSAVKKGFTAKWKKKSGVSGYELQYSISKNFKKAKIKKVNKAKAASQKITKLKANKKYYVRIRTYKMVGKEKYVSSWSKAKTVRTK